MDRSAEELFDPPVSAQDRPAVEEGLALLERLKRSGLLVSLRHPVRSGRPESDVLADFWTKLGERSHSNLYFALILLDRRRRNAFRDVYRFVRAADDAVDSSEPAAARLARLDLWRQQLATIYQPTSDAHTLHPYALQLRRVVDEFRLSREHFERLLDGLEQDVRGHRQPSYAALEAYCEAVAAPLAYLCLQILGVAGPAEEAYARKVSIALQLGNILRDVAEDAARGQIYLPQDELVAAGVTEGDILAGRMPEGLAPVCRRLADHARRLIGEARRELPPDSRRGLLVPEIWADVYLDLLGELEQDQFDVFDHPPYQHRRRKLLLALRRWGRQRLPGQLFERFFSGPPGCGS